MVLKITDYGLIGNCRTAALVSKRGSIDWCCFPNFDSPSIFGALLDAEKGGLFSIAPTTEFRSRQRYLEDTNVLETTFEQSGGEARLIDTFPVRYEHDNGVELWPDQEIIRVLKPISGELEFRLVFAPRPQYASRRVHLQQRDRFGIICCYGQRMVLLRSEVPLELRETAAGSEAFATFRVRAGQQVIFSLTYGEEAPAVIPMLGNSALQRLDLTIDYWKGWLRQCRYEGLYRDHVRRSALTLKLLTFAPSGAIVAAATTSLPEALGGVRNWDYRYCWLRDAGITTRSMLALGFIEEATAYMNWTLHATHLTRPRLQVLYTVYGKPPVKERHIDSLSGYAASKPVRVGNAAHDQFQLDVYGEALDGLFQLAPFLGRIDSETRRFVLEKAGVVCSLWNEPDEGIWEGRSGRSHHTHSKALAWVALDRATRLAERFGWEAPFGQFRFVADQLRDSIETHGYSDELGSYTRTLGSQELDASLLALPLMGYCAASSPRMRSTRRAICEKLSRNGFIYRYALDRAEDGLPRGEGSFGICNFWLAENLALDGQVDEARRWFETILKRSNELGLWSEEIDPDTGEFLGNYPQAFTHVGLINSARAITLASEGRR